MKKPDLKIVKDDEPEVTARDLINHLESVKAEETIGRSQNILRDIFSDMAESYKEKEDKNE